MMLSDAIKRGAAVCLGAGVMACGSGDGNSVPTTPSSTAAPSTPPLVEYVISGAVVEENGTPVDAADVESETERTMTAEDGTYTLRLLRRAQSTWIRASKAGYVPNVTEVVLDASRVTVAPSLRLSLALRIRAGERVDVHVGPDAQPCGLEYEWICRTVIVVADKPGTLNAEARGAGPAPEVGLLVRPTDARFSGPINYPFRLANRATHSFDAPGEIAVDVLVSYTTTARVLLTTSFTTR